MLRSKKTVYQKERSFIFAYSNKRKMANIAYRNKHSFAFFLVLSETFVPLGCCLPMALIKAATLEEGSSNLVGTWSVWFLRHQ